MPANRQSVRFLEISAAQAGQRIDNFLIKHLKNIPKSHIYRLLRSGQVRVNSGRKKPTYKLHEGDRLRIPPVHHDPASPVSVPETVLQALDAAILHEDDDLLAIDKPAGLAVHKGSGLSFGVIEAMRLLRPQLSLELVHRLDRETSGCLLLAKNRACLGRLHALLRQSPDDKRQAGIEKRYLALVCGHWPGETRCVDQAITKIRQGGEHIMVADDRGQRAISHFEVVERFAEATLMAVRIETGRMHQIRVHAQYCGHPVAGDSRYGDKAQNRRFRQQGLKRLFLHASRLWLPLQPPVTIQARLSPELADCLESLRDTHTQAAR